MNVVLTDQVFHIKHVYFTEPVINTIIENSEFVKIIYSDQNMMLNGVYMLLYLKTTHVEQHFNKIKYVYNIEHDNIALSKIFKLEEDILDKYKSSKQKKYIIREYLSNGNIKLFPSIQLDRPINVNTFILKVSGIWENEHEYGLTYKILPI